jgi:hypothetical protein
MGILDRIGKIASGIGGALHAPVGLVYDLARAPFVDEDELDGFVNVLYGRTVNRGGEFFGNLLGPQEGLGAVFGAAPEAVRQPVRAATTPILAGLETAGREVIREPLTAAVTAASLQQAGRGFDIREGYRIAQNRSLGQATALAFLTDDITDEAQVARATGSDWYQAISGTMDAATRLFLDVDVLVGGALAKARKAGVAARTTRVLENIPGAARLVERGVFGRTIRTKADVEAALVHPSLRRINDQITEIRSAAPDVDSAAARIRDLAFPDHRDGAYIGRVLAEADDLPTAWGALMGHQPSIEALYGSGPDIAGQISRLSGDQARIAELKRMGFELPDSVKTVERSQLDTEIDALYDVEARLVHNEQANAMVRELPRISRASETRTAITRSDFFQANPLAAPLRLAVNMRPRNMVDLHDAAGDAQVARVLRKARVPLEDQDRLRGAYMAAADPTARNAVLAEAEGVAISSLAQRHGITDADEISKLVDSSAELRTGAMGEIQKSRQYDGAGRAFVENVDDRGVTHRTYLPVGVTQEFNHYLLPDLDALDQVFSRAGKEAARFGKPLSAVMDANVEILEAFQRVWKPSVLLRVGWPIRVVGEEQIRIMSQIGALLTVGRSVKAGARYGKDTVADLVSNASQAARRIPREERVARQAGTRGLRLGTRNIRGWEMESAFGTAETFHDVYRQLNSAGSAFQAVTRNGDDLRTGLRTEVLGEWQSLDPTVRGWGEAWEHAANNQIGKDEMWRQFLEGKSVDEVREWIETTAEGRAYLRRLPHWKGRIDEWLEVAKQTADDYLPTDELRVLALEGKARTADIVAAIPDAAGRPTVHGAVLADVSGKTRAAMAVGKLRDTAMKVLGTIPTDVLSRQPYFDYHYTQEVERLVNLAADQGVAFTPELARGFEAKARNYALGESKRLLYDLAEESELAHMLRFVSPFYSAWQEVLTRWTGITVDNPAFVARMQEVWRSPEKAGVVTDEDGNRLNADGSATSPLGEKVEPGGERFINVAMFPPAVKDLMEHVPGVNTNVKLNKEGLNLILQGAPGVGPLIQIPMNEIAKGRPELEASMRWALPFGTTQSTIDMLLPATARRLKTKAGGEEDRLYSNQLMRIYWDMAVDHNLGKRAEAPTYAEAKKKTDSFYNLRTVASFVSPVAPSFQSPYQLQIDAYRALKEKDPETADEIFLRDYGPEFFVLTQSLSKTMDGVPPTLEGAAARRKYQDLVERHPELGGLIIGAEGAGEFVSSVYQSQLSQRLRPGSPDRQRKAFSFEEAIAKPNERLGWQEYGRAMDLVDAERANRGLPNLQVRGATDLREAKKAIIDALARKYPEWHAAFSVTDRNAWAKRLAGMRDIAADDRLVGRPDIAGLRRYLEVRDAFVGELVTRGQVGGAKTISAVANVDLAGAWEQVKTKLVDQNPAFAALFYRYLERDPLDVESAVEVA